MPAPISPRSAVRGTVLDAAKAWAKDHGFKSIVRIPADRAAAAVADVAAQTGLAPAVVREQLVKHWSAHNDRAATSLADLGAQPAYQGGADHRPLTTAQGMRPMAALLAQRAASPGTRGASSARPTTLPPMVAAERLLSRRLRRELDTAFGKEGAALFEWPTQVAKGADSSRGLGPALDPGAVARFERDLVAAATAAGPAAPLSAPVRNALFAQKDELVAMMRDIVLRPSPQAFAVFLDALAPLLESAAKDRGVFMKGVASGDLGEITFRAMRPSERALEQLKDTDPDAYQVVMKRRETLKEWDAGVLAACAQENLDPRKARLLGQLVTIAVDRVTDERVVFSPQWGAQTMDAFIASRKEFLAAKAALQKEPAQLEVKIEDLPRADVDVATLPGPVRYASLTDDLAKDDPLTRIFAVKEHAGRDVVVEGKFAGCYTDALINASGRLVEGRAFKFDEKLGRTREVPLTPGTAAREPYVTATTVKVRGNEKQALFLSLPNAQGEWTDVRQAVRALSKRIPSIRYEQGSKNTRFTFEPKDFAVVREQLGGMALSSGARDMVQGWFKDLAAASHATAVDNLGAYAAAAIGGFKAAVRTNGVDAPVQLSTAQAQALAWLEANDGRGVVALDTGMGKTMLAIASMQKHLRDAGSDDDGKRFLFVCPPALRGNLAKEIHRWLQPAAADRLLARLDVVSYGELRAQQRSGKLDAAKYASVFFDEAQALKNPHSETAKAALGFDHPHKVCLTASPMEKNPMEAYVLASVAGNVDLMDPAAGKELRREMRKFRERFAETVGGRIVGVVQDPITLGDMHTWLRKNVFYVEKNGLPELTKTTETVVMTGDVEAAYRDASKSLSRALQGMVSLYRDKGLLGDGKKNALAKDPKIAGVLGIGLRDVLKRLNDLQNMPGKLVPGAGFPKIDRAGEIVTDRLRASNGAARAILFSDDREMVTTTALLLSKKAPAGKIHAACLNDEIRLYKNGRELTSFAGHDLPFAPHPYRNDMSKASNKTTNRHYPKAQWQQYVLGELLGPTRDVLTCTMLGQTYQTGQNLQAFDTCIHLDRDTWCSEDMRQRTARLWRQGQENAVAEITIDAVYDAPRMSFDATLDEVRKHQQVMEGELFDVIVKGAQGKELGAEFFDMDAKNASSVQLDRATLDLMASPYVARSRPPGERDVDGAA